ncbi:MAG: B12-binding domain-containing radical SAM protein [Candidatus Omnitrophica bacterium]|nr:B12-binding domain-containing radical SAM protein [Candidatus Omnitrophota bacterium]
MEKILLLNPPGTSRYLRDQYCSSSAKAFYYWPPIDLLVINGILRAHYNVTVLDAIVENLDATQTFDFIKQGGYDGIVALSSAASKDEDFALFKKLKTRLGVKILANAGFLRFESEKALRRYSFLDAVILDFTEIGSLLFLKGERGSLPGIAYRDHDSIIKNFGDFNDNFSYPVPAHRSFPLAKYYMPQARYRPFTCVLASSGCKFNCKFCSSSKIPFRKRNINNLIHELHALGKLGVREVHFPDFTFTADKQHCLDICRAIKKEGIILNWDCLTRPDCVDEELLLEMKQAGCHTVQFGVETKNEEVLLRLDKHLKNSQITDAFGMCKKHGIETIGFFIIGLPDEGRQEIEDTIKFACELDCDYASFSIFVPDYGSNIREKIKSENSAILEGYCLDRTKFPVWQKNASEVWRLRNKAVRKFYLRPRYFLRRLIKIRSWHEFAVQFINLFFLLKSQIRTH